MTTIKVAKLRFSAQLMQSILKGDWSVLCRKTTAPEDLEVLGVEQPPDGIGHWFYVIVKSNTFAAIPEGADLPEIDAFSYHSEPATKGAGP